MKIALNARVLTTPFMESYGRFAYEIFLRLATLQKEHEFFFISDKPLAHGLKFPANVIPVVVGPEAKHPLLLKLWLDYRLPATLRKMKADIFICPDGMCSQRANIPQCMVVHDLLFMHHPRMLPTGTSSFYKKYSTGFFKKAQKIITTSDFTRKDICRHFHLQKENLAIIPGAASDAYQPLDWDQRVRIIEKYSDGKEYFLFVGAISPRKNLVSLLKAFSIFKKWQKSNLNLLIAGRLDWQYEQFIGSLETYKYRYDVKLLGYVPVDELAPIMASANALVYPSLFEGFGCTILEAMQCSVPVLSSKSAALPETGGDAASYFDPDKVQDIADKMIDIYKNEKLRDELRQKGPLRANEFSWNRSASLMWEIICETAKPYSA